MAFGYAFTLLLLGVSLFSNGAMATTTTATTTPPAAQPALLVAAAPDNAITITPAPAPTAPVPVSIVVTGTPAQIAAVKLALTPSPAVIGTMDLTSTAPAATTAAAGTVNATTADAAATAGPGTLNGTIVGPSANITVVPTTPGVVVGGAATGTGAAAYVNPLVPLTTTTSGYKLSMAPLGESAGERSSVTLALLLGGVFGAALCLL